MAPAILLLVSAHAWAADPAFEGAQKPGSIPMEPVTTLFAEFGGAWVSGNTVAYTLNGAARGAHRWKYNQVSARLGAMVGRAVADTDGNGHLSDDERTAGEAETARRYEGEVRYDRFLSRKDSLYVLSGAFADRFAGYDWQVHGQLGVSHAFVQMKTAAFYGEIGVDVAREDFIEGADPNAQNVISPRLLIGGGYAFNPAVRIDDQVELLENLLQRDDIRVRETASLTAALTTKLSIRVSYTLAFDNVPVKGPLPGTRDDFEPIDQSTVVSFVASLL